MPSFATAQATQVSYELHSLGWKAFQDLCTTVTSEVLGQTIQAFLPSKDGGRDGAFYGIWRPEGAGLLSGSYTIQCKFTATPHATLSPGHLRDELHKARRLVEAGLADNYVLMTNFSVSG